MSRSDESVETESSKEAIAEEEEAEEGEEAEKIEEKVGVEEETGEEEKVEKERKVKEDIVEERVYNVPLGRAWVSPRKERAPKATRILRSFIKRHMKPDSIVLTEEVNERIWRRGIEKPPRKIRVRAVKDRDGRVSIHLAEGD